MTDNLNVALQLLALGMSITFGALFLLWGLMALLTFLTSRGAGEETTAAPSVEAGVSPPDQEAVRERRRRAAAAAVAVALAREQMVRSSVSPTSAVSPWQAATRMVRFGRQGREQS
jgi:Na+-transporting methylmalonyl-CoA/oxaloacetate decarboxylase gamma subunit